MFYVFCNDNYIAQRETEQGAVKFIDERKAKYPKSNYRYVEGDKTPTPSELNPQEASAEPYPFQ